jgi:tripartite-type tricarboxylate transporter receptor subunit TctC
MNTRLNRRRLLQGAAALTALPAIGAHAQTFPARTVTLVAPSTPGSAPDVVARLVAQRLSEAWGQSVVVMNRPGAGTDIGSESVARAEPDGYTILLGSIANTVNPHLIEKRRYELADLAPVAMVAVAPDLLVVHPSVPARTVQELIALLKADPTMPAGHAGIGTTPHLSLELFRRMGGVNFVSVPFQGGGAAQQGILSEQVRFMFSTSLGILPLVRGGRLRALAVSSAQRSSALASLPTLAESGLPEFDVAAWFGTFVPARTPQPVVDRIAQSVRAVVSAPDFTERIRELGADVRPSSQAEFGSFVAAEYARWERLVKEANLRRN